MTATKSRQWPATISALYLAIRVSAANLSPIMDCDEVYNYWEPLHFVLYGAGMQTWEYAPQYALRTYAYILPMAAMAKCHQFLLDRLPSSFVDALHKLLMLPHTSPLTTVLGSKNKPLLFAMLRSSLALTSAYSELSFLRALHDVIGPDVAYWTAFVQLTSAGYFHASQAYLPSSTVMILWQLSISNQLRDRHGWAIFWGLVAVLAVGWPFCAVLFVSTGCWALWNAYGDAVRGRCSKQSSIRVVIHVLMRTLFHAIGIQGAVVSIDYYYYGRIVSPIWNIFSYNARGGGDELYGIEPLSYYIKNLALNFNVVGLLGIIAPLVLAAKMVVKPYRSVDSFKILGLVPMYMWLAIVLPRPHKEERFLFPIYPMISFGAAITLDVILDAILYVVSNFKSKNRSNDQLKSYFKLVLGLLVLVPAAAISISRSFALHRHYAAPLALYQDLFSHISEAPPPSGGVRHYVCTGGEWYRFPSSFFLPETAQLEFLKSSFGGQLPQPFTRYGSKSESIDVQVGQFNDMNREEVDRYISIGDCSYVVEMVTPTTSEESKAQETPECIQYMAADASGSWNRLTSFKYVDTESTQALHRILYLPFGRENKVQYKEYNVYSRSKSTLEV